MFPLCLEHRTELIFWRAFSEVIDRGDYVVVSTPRCREWFFGNLLIFPSPPGLGDAKRWTELYRAEFGGDARVRHRLFAWRAVDDDPGDDAAALVLGGYRLDTTCALVAKRVTDPPYPNGEVEVRTLSTGDDWEQAIALFLAERPARFEAEEYERYLRSRFDDYRRLIARGAGDWFGAFAGGELAGHLGLFRNGAVARFQSVITAPAMRRRGICGTLVAHAARRALEAGVEEVVIVANENGAAQRIYESVGFRRADRCASLLLEPAQR